ncbi:amidohydrolase [Flavihumibacter sp. UBA7668]|uniref:amidohydrolase n=1 Tax=Flavihumibacter sp. UBA7668 TaxID=1946542 RepID=UPI0025BBB914|nr:amidohydrolase [Flavihumibacter sp. UBA7668]
MKSFFQLAIIALVSIFCWACSGKPSADLLIRNAVIYTVDSQFSKATSMAIRDGKILAIGSDENISSQYSAKELFDAKGKFIYPGFIDAHCHFYRYGLGLQTADLVGTTSWQAILDTLVKFSAIRPEGWIIGRGWDQNDWSSQEFPTNEALNKLFPDRPVLLSRIDGHAAMANSKALELAGIKAGDQLTGGKIEVKNGQLTGLLIDNAIGLVESKITAPTEVQMKEALLDAQRNCFAMGLTTVDDCGLDYNEVEFIDGMQKSGELKMRIYAMLSDSKKNYDYLLPKGIIKTDRLNVRSFKVYADGALGSRGACLLEDYADHTGNKGFLLSDPEHFDSIAALLAKTPFQMNTHAIGDSGNRTILKIYAKHLVARSDRRWRIEHAQVVNASDFALFGQYGIIPSVQPTHATSDMYWAGKRLGSEREKGAYAFQDLMKQNGWIPLGTDFPVEDISPFKTFYAAVVRQDAKGFPAGGYQPENALSREEALRGMTIWAAKSNFEEAEKGSLEPGKLADFILLDQDLLAIPSDRLLVTRVLGTWISGEKVH